MFFVFILVKDFSRISEIKQLRLSSDDATSGMGL